VQAEEFTARGGKGREFRGGDAIRHGGVRLVDGEHGSCDLRPVHPAECDEVPAGVDDGRGHQDRPFLGFGVGGRNHS
jgi:hypothetical protein